MVGFLVENYPICVSCKRRGPLAAPLALATSAEGHQDAARGRIAATEATPHSQRHEPGHDCRHVDSVGYEVARPPRRITFAHTPCPLTPRWCSGEVAKTLQAQYNKPYLFTWASNASLTLMLPLCMVWLRVRGAPSPAYAYGDVEAVRDTVGFTASRHSLLAPLSVVSHRNFPLLRRILAMRRSPC